MILSGGSGSRLWPVSRESYPKQFCEFFDRSFLQQTIDRVSSLGSPMIITLESMKNVTQRVTRGAGLSDQSLILEPYPKNTAGAIALGVHLLSLQGKKDEVVGVFPADHLISNDELFLQACGVAKKWAEKGKVVTLGIEPRYPATGYGYIQTKQSEQNKKLDPMATVVHPVVAFCEKPNEETAQKFILRGGYFWNAGIFIFSVSTMQNLLQKHMPELWKRISLVKADLSNLKSIYANITAESIDYGVMEKVQEEMICVVSDFGWSDVGSWDELARLHDEERFIDSKGRVITEQSENNFVYSSSSKVVGLLGVQNLIVIETPDALLVGRRGQSQDVKKLVDKMRMAHLPEATGHPSEMRPWGGFEVLSDAINHKVKRLTVDVGAQLSLQKHLRRDETWVVISGQAEIVLEDKSILLNPNEHYRVVRGVKHRIKNSGRVPLVLVEVQTGDYFGEDDIERFEDDYQRI